MVSSRRRSWSARRDAAAKASDAAVIFWCLRRACMPPTKPLRSVVSCAEREGVGRGRGPPLRPPFLQRTSVRFPAVAWSANGSSREIACSCDSTTGTWSATAEPPGAAAEAADAAPTAAPPASAFG